MKLSEFGKAVRKARLETDTSLLAMARELEVSSSYLSGLETGRKKITSEWVTKIKQYFEAKGVHLHDLEELADVSNQTVSLEGLSPAHQMLVAGFARATPDAEMLEKLNALLKAANPEKGD